MNVGKGKGNEKLIFSTGCDKIKEEEYAALDLTPVPSPKGEGGWEDLSEDVVGEAECIKCITALVVYLPEIFNAWPIQPLV